MWTLIRNGGVIPMSVILLFGAAALLGGFFFAVRAEKRTFGFVRWMALATLFATLAATAADLGATLSHCAEAWDETSRESDVRVHHMEMEGFAESTSPGILGFSILGVTAMLVAVGRRRLDDA